MLKLEVTFSAKGVISPLLSNLNSQRWIEGGEPATPRGVAKLRVEINEEKSRLANLAKGTVLGSWDLNFGAF